MTTAAQARSQIKKLIALSEKKPSFYFVHGYFAGLAANPEMLMPAKWIPLLFGQFELEEEQDMALMESVLWHYNQVMQSAMQCDLRLPNQCKLSPSNVEQSLAEDAPLPQWCRGYCAGLKLIDKRKLNKAQKDLLTDVVDFFRPFRSQASLLEHITANRSSWLSVVKGDWLEIAMAMRKQMIAEINNLIYEIRFADHDHGEHEPLQDYSETNDEFDELLDFALYANSDEARTVREDLINLMAQQFGEAFFTENRGHFWLIHETRPYMMLRAMRARDNFARGLHAAAIDEVQQLIDLNPNDNQGVRFALANWLVIQQDWQALKDLFALYAEDGGLMMQAPKALMLYAQEGDSANAQAAKKAMLTANKHVVAYLTGQRQIKQAIDHYSPGEPSEAIMYLAESGKEAWRSVPGALFWLRKRR